MIRLLLIFELFIFGPLKSHQKLIWIANIYDFRGESLCIAPSIHTMCVNTLLLAWLWKHSEHAMNCMHGHRLDQPLGTCASKPFATMTTQQVKASSSSQGIVLHCFHFWHHIFDQVIPPTPQDELSNVHLGRDTHCCWRPLNFCTVRSEEWFKAHHQDCDNECDQEYDVRRGALKSHPGIT